MTTTIGILRLAMQFEKQLLDGYNEYLEAVEEDHRNGHRSHYCEHGTNNWTDYDNICGPCEDGITMSDGLQRRKYALSLAHARHDDALAAIMAVSKAQIALEKCGFSGQTMGKVLDVELAYKVISARMQSISSAEPFALLYGDLDAEVA